MSRISAQTIRCRAMPIPGSPLKAGHRDAGARQPRLGRNLRRDSHRTPCLPFRQTCRTGNKRAGGVVEGTAAQIGTLCHEDLSFEIQNLRQLGVARPARHLFMRHRSRNGLAAERSLAAIRHQADSVGCAGARLRCPGEICHHARPPKQGNRVLPALHAINRIGIAARGSLTTSIVKSGVTEAGGHAIAMRNRPRLIVSRVGRHGSLRQARAIGPVHRREDGVLCRRFPSSAGAASRPRHSWHWKADDR